MAKTVDKFLLLMWKNWTLLKRQPIYAIFDLIYPVLICLILVAIRYKIDITQEPNHSYNASWTTNFTNTYLCRSSQNQNVIAYSPKSELVGTILKNLKNELTTKCPQNVSLQLEAFGSSRELNFKIDNNSTFSESLKMGIIFNDDLKEKLVDVSLTIRLPTVYEFSPYQHQDWYTYLTYPIFQMPGPRQPYREQGGSPDYFYRGFIFLQQSLALSLLNNSKTRLYPLKFKRFPYPTWTDDIFFVNQMEVLISMVIMISFMYHYINTVRAITTEKEKQLKESMKIMGLPGWLHWTAWFFRSFIILFFAIIPIVLVLRLLPYHVPVLRHSDPSVLFVFFMVYASATITFCFLISVFFSKANTATAIGSLVFFLASLPYILQQQGDASLLTTSNLFSSILANSGLAFGISVILKFEAVEEGIHWHNLWSTPSPDYNVTLGGIILVLLFDTFLYLFGALYVEAIFPGDFGVPKKWYFPFTKSFWCNNLDNGNATKHIKRQSAYFENFTHQLPVGIRLQNLSKSFSGNKVVTNLNLDMYQDHITVLLGHNGAGKTTTMSMITGMVPPSVGTAIVNNFDVRTNTQKVRDSMGICFQHNVLFDNLTVYEHLYFFGKLKGLEKNQLQEEIDKYIKLLEMDDKRHARSSTLSGGMKRKLSVAAALCGRSKVVILDEPTAGMDPAARRTTWNLIQKQKKGRTILLTTHFMDEADLLSDRIAIMTNGQLQCCGTSFFLKRKFGTGYYLILDTEPQCLSAEVTKLLAKHMPNIEIFSNVGSELTYQLSDQDSSQFEQMLFELETNSKELGVRSYGVSLTTLEEVFMKVGTDHSDRHKYDQMGTIRLNKGCRVIWNQLLAMILKRWLSMKRTWYSFLLQSGLSIILLIVTILNARDYLPLTKYPRLHFSLNSYKSPVTLLESLDEHSWFSSYKSGLYQSYKQVLTKNIVREVDNIDEIILNLTKDSPSIVKSHYITGATFDNFGATAWFNGDPYHAIPLSVGLILKAAYHQNNLSIEFYNHPLPLTVDAELNNLSFINIMGFQIAIEFGYGLAFVSAFYVIFYIKERVSKSKHLQFLSGVNIFIYWWINFLWDLITYLIITFGIIITFAALQEDGYKTPEELQRMSLLLVAFGFFMLPSIYIASYFFTITSSGFAKIMLIGTVGGMVGIIVIQVLEIKTLGLMDIAVNLNWVLLFIPFYSVSKGAYDLGAIYSTKQLCSKISKACQMNEMCCEIHDYYAMTTPGIGRNVIISFLMSLVLLATLLLNELGFFGLISNKLVKNVRKPNTNFQLEEDVQLEKTKIKSTATNEYSLVLQDVTKYYKDFLAVNGVCLGVKPFECFGLLGVNGAGKTTTFKMMTGDEQISFGEAFVNGLNIKTQQKEVQKLIGYCPQFDALLDDLTARETLKIFALIRGVPLEDCQNLGEHLAHEFDFVKHLDKQVKELSGGNKRKLSTALALIGDPPIIFLDEPTTGMDPASKRFLWDALAKLRDSGKCIILTSHSMEECEALCTRLAIMVNGNFRCLGSTQRLKNKFAQGFALTIKIEKCSDEVRLQENVWAVEAFVNRVFPGAELKEQYQQLLSYQLMNNSMPWSHMFGVLEKSKEELHIEDYSLGQCSLEQVFLSFTKYQN